MASIARYRAWVSVFGHRERTYGDERVTRGGPVFVARLLRAFPMR